MGQDAAGGGNGASRMGLKRRFSRAGQKIERINLPLFEHLLDFFLEPFPSGKLPGRLGSPTAERFHAAKIPGDVKQRQLQRTFLQLNYF